MADANCIPDPRSRKRSANIERVNATMKRCARCGVIKSKDEFGKDSNKLDGIKPHCRPCHNAINREVRRKHPDKAAGWSAKWQGENPEKVREKRNRSNRRRMQNPIHRLRGKIGTAVRASLAKGEGQPGAFRHLDYTLQELKSHLERQFLPGMSWQNMEEWHVDHIVPVSSFNITGPECAEFKRAWALTNLRPLWAKDNRRKHAKITHLI